MSERDVVRLIFDLWKEIPETVPQGAEQAYSEGEPDRVLFEYAPSPKQSLDLACAEIRRWIESKCEAVDYVKSKHGYSVFLLFKSPMGSMLCWHPISRSSEIEALVESARKVRAFLEGGEGDR